MNKIISSIEWCNANQGFMSVVLTFFLVILTAIYVRTTVKISKANKKSVDAMNKSVKASEDSVASMDRSVDLQNYIRKQNVRIQLYEKRRKVYSEFVRSVKVLKDKEYSETTIILLDALFIEDESKKHNIDFMFTDVGHVFGRKYNKKVINLVGSARDVANQFSKCRKLEQEIKVFFADTNERGLVRRGENPEFDIYKELRIAISANEKFKISKKFKEICDNNIITINMNGEKKEYNYYVELEKRQSVIGDFEKKYERIRKLLESELYLNDIE